MAEASESSPAPKRRARRSTGTRTTRTTRGAAARSTTATRRRAGTASDAVASLTSMVDELIKENQDSGLGSGFDNASRNVKLPKKSLPTLSPSTAETTQTSIAEYETIVAKGGWPECTPVARTSASP